MKEIRVAVQAEDTKNLIDGIIKVIEKIKEGHGSIPIYYNNGKYKIRFTIIADAEFSSSFEDSNLISTKEDY